MAGAHLRSRVALLRLCNTKTVSKQPLIITTIVHGRRVWIYRRIWCMLELTYAQVQCDPAHWRLV